ncbi:MAG: hypothetical protein KDB14_02080 [Planctomycetales bacterium]|nr:hypothetical protein [Planctomycetales bacterium]
MLEEQQLQELHEFVSGNRGWEQWPRWLAINASSLARQLDREQFARLKENPLEEIPVLLRDFSATVVSTSPTIVRDPIENDPAIRAIVDAAEAQAIEELGIHDDSQPGVCHRIWAAQTRILKETHGIEWRSPAELNEDVVFD